MKILTEVPGDNWQAFFSETVKSNAINALEQGQVLLFNQLCFPLLPHENAFLSPRYSDPKAKNISFNPAALTLTGTQCSPQEYNQIKAMMQRYAACAVGFIQRLFPRYQASLQIGRTSFRPVEIAGRVSSYRKDDTRLHVDAFPSSPNQGRRILRLFTNINPEQPRLWRVGAPFEDVAQHFLPKVRKPWPGKSTLLHLLRLTKSQRTAYDHIMLQIHDLMKGDLHYQKTAEQTAVAFAPGTSWIVQTDHVSHAAMAGQHVLEQTFYLPVNAMLAPTLSPLRTLERLSGHLLV